MPRYHLIIAENTAIDILDITARVEKILFTTPEVTNRQKTNERSKPPLGV